MINPHFTARLKALNATGRLDAHTVARFAEFIVTAPDEELFRMSPLRYAKHASLTHETAIDLFLCATHAGLLDFSWGVLCPSCGAFLTKQSGLRWLRAQKRCSLCQLETTPALDEQIEVAFTVAPAVRAIRFHNLEELDFARDGFFTFFSTSITLYPEIHQIVHSSVQASYRVPAATTHEIVLNFEPNHYLLMAPTTHAVAHIPVAEGHLDHVADFELLFDGQWVPEHRPLAPGAGRLRLHNRTKQALCLGLLREQRMAPTPPEQRTSSLYARTPYLTGKALINSQTFCDLFHAESVPPASGLEVKHLTVLFTDLKGSTALYDRIGDFDAYALVREHFALLRGIVAARQGAIVKTMGDAIMASFADPLAALEAASVMRRETQKASGGEELILKIGLHSGTCIAVETNAHLDYFGQTVNIAARVQAVAEAGEIVCTEAIYALPEAAQVLRKAGLHATQDQALLKGVGSPVTFYRLR